MGTGRLFRPGRTGVAGRRARAASLVALLAGVSGGVWYSSRDGLPARESSTATSTRWFADPLTGYAVLADGLSGLTLARVDTEIDDGSLLTVDGEAGSYAVDRTTGEVRAIDERDLRLGTARPTTANASAQMTATAAGLFITEDSSNEALIVPIDGTPTPLTLGTADRRLVSEAGTVWSVGPQRLTQQRGDVVVNTEVRSSDIVEMTVVGDSAVVADRAGRVRWFDGAWVDTGLGETPRLVEPGDGDDCAWVALDDTLLCVGRDAIERRFTVDGLSVGELDRLAVVGNTAVVVGRGPASIQRIDLVSETIDRRVEASPAATATLRVQTLGSVVWVDAEGGGQAWAVHDWGIRVIDKRDVDAPLLTADGDVVTGGDPGEGTETDPGDIDPEDTVDPEPDDNGIDDPPQAIDDFASGRAGSPLNLFVTANDFDPDGEAIAVSAFTQPSSGSVEQVAAGVLVYRPDDTARSDAFEYTIVDGNGTEDTAVVEVVLIPPGAANERPIAIADTATTAAETPVVVPVLRNDTDPERDPLRIDSFTSPDTGVGTVLETRGADGVPSLRFVPAAGFTGTASFTYRVVDTGDEVSDAATVTVEVALGNAANRPPVVRPDSVLLRVGDEQRLPVMANDTDPENDQLTLLPLGEMPRGLVARAEGNDLVLTAQVGAPRLLSFGYQVDDGRGNVVTGSVLAIVLEADAENQPPLAITDLPRLVAGTSVIVDVLANDSDPDGDPLTVTAVVQPSDGGATIAIVGNQVQITAPTTTDLRTRTVNMGYRINDGNGNAADGAIVATVLPVAPPEPPYAVDDAATTFENKSVVIDVLRNDGDPSGERPSLIGEPGCLVGGSATVTSGARVLFTPPPDETGTFRCTYRVGNSQGLEAAATITVIVEAEPLTNQPPRTVADSATVEVGATITIDVLSNDTDPDGTTADLELTSISGGLRLGTARIAGRSIVYTAPDEGTGVVEIGYQVADADGATASGSASVTVTDRPQQPPVAVSDRDIVEVSAPRVIDVLRNDEDPDGARENLRLQSVSRVSGDGEVSLSSGGVLMSPEPDFVGSLVGSYTIVDEDGLTATTTVTLEVRRAQNRRPLAGPDSFEIRNGSVFTGTVLRNDSDPDNDPLTVELESRPDAALGVFTWDDGNFSFASRPGESGQTSFTYRISDGEESATATATLRVLPCTESLPIAGESTVTTGYQQPLAIDLADYSSGGEIIDVAGVITTPTGVYTPPAGENGVVRVTYVVRNGCGLTANGVLLIDVNQDPIAGSASVSVSAGSTASIGVAQLASDREPLTISDLQGNPAWASLTNPSTIALAPPADLKGRFTFTAVVADPGGLTATANVTVDVGNAAPIANPDEARARNGLITLDLLANDSDPEGNALSLQSVPTTVTFDTGDSASISTTGGSVQISVSGVHGVGTFQYTVADSVGNVSAPATVTITANTPPRAFNTSAEIESGETVTVPIDTRDRDGDALTVTMVDGPAWVVGATPDDLVIAVPAGTAAGVYNLTYRVTDTYGDSAQAVVVVTVTDPPAPPTTTTTTAPPTTAPPTTAPPTSGPPTS